MVSSKHIESSHVVTLEIVLDDLKLIIELALLILFSSMKSSKNLLIFFFIFILIFFISSSSENLNFLVKSFFLSFSFVFIIGFIDCSKAKETFLFSVFWGLSNFSCIWIGDCSKFLISGFSLLSSFFGSFTSYFSFKSSIIFIK